MLSNEAPGRVEIYQVDTFVLIIQYRTLRAHPPRYRDSVCCPFKTREAGINLAKFPLDNPKVDQGGLAKTLSESLVVAAHGWGAGTNTRITLVCEL